MGIPALAMGALQLGMSYMSARSESNAAAAAAEQQGRYAQEQYNLQAQEVARRQDQADTQAKEQKSDRIREAERQLGAARAAAAEGIGMLDRSVTEIGAAEGMDLSRIEGNRSREIESLQSEVKAARSQAASTIESATRSAKNARKAAIGKVIGSGVQIGMNMYGQKVDADQKAAQREEDKRLLATYGKR